MTRRHMIYEIRVQNKADTKRITFTNERSDPGKEQKIMNGKTYGCMYREKKENKFKG